MTEQDRLKNNSFDRLPIGDVPYLKILVDTYKDDPKLTKEWFFLLALSGFYDAMRQGLDSTAGHIIYRLSDAIEKSQRESMAIYPTPTGSIIFNENEVDVENERVRWDSLEDWRKEWERIHPVIPDYVKRLPETLV